MKRSVKAIAKISAESRHRDIIVHKNTIQINSIVQKLDFNGNLCTWSEDKPSIVNMIGWHRFPTSLPKGFHERSDEVMLSLYKINEVVFEAIVIYTSKIFNYESGNYEYRRNSFMRFIPHERKISITRYLTNRVSIGQQLTVYQYTCILSGILSYTERFISR